MSEEAVGLSWDPEDKVGQPSPEGLMWQLQATPGSILEGWKG
jgi:hypothetical protein